MVTWLRQRGRAPLLLTDGRRAWIEQVERRPGEVTVYGIAVERAQDYFVGPASGSEAVLTRSD